MLVCGRHNFEAGQWGVVSDCAGGSMAAVEC